MKRNIHKKIIQEWFKKAVEDELSVHSILKHREGFILKQMKVYSKK